MRKEWIFPIVLIVLDVLQLLFMGLRATQEK